MIQEATADRVEDANEDNGDDTRGFMCVWSHGREGHHEDVTDTSIKPPNILAGSGVVGYGI